MRRALWHTGSNVYLTEQLAIVDFLDAELSKLEKLGATAEHAIALMKERQSALIAAAVAGQIDVRGAVPQRTMKEEVAV